MPESRQGYFITGTDTGVGKTLISCALITALRGAGHVVAGMKPVASGCEIVDGALRNPDALQLMAASGLPLDYDDVNPYAFAPAIAPHIAARRASVEIRLDTVLQHYRRSAQQAEIVIVEGVGGWQVPLGPELTTVQLAQALALPVVLVVGLRLGCMNHAFLTQQAITHAGLRCAGWVANHIAPDFAEHAETVLMLAQGLNAPLIGTIPYMGYGIDGSSEAARHLEAGKLGL